MGSRSRIHATWLGVALLFWLNTGSTADPDGTQQAVDAAWQISLGRAAAIERAAPAIVAIRARGALRREQGSGILVGAEGLVLTAHHVVDGCDSIEVLTADGTQYAARVRGFDRPSDLALLELAADGRRFPVARLGFSAEARVGESVVALASPFGLARTASAGIVSAKGRTQVVSDNVVPLLQTDASINPGSSGGALINLKGEVLGMINAILTRSGKDQGIGFAVPADEIRRVLPALKAGESVRRPWIGVRVATEGGVEGSVRVVEVLDRGPAKSAGLRPSDRILRLDGRRVESVAEMRAVLRNLTVGTSVPVEYVRADQAHRAQLAVGTKSKKPNK